MILLTVLNVVSVFVPMFDLTPLPPVAWGPSPPEGLYAPRQRARLGRLDTGWPEPGMIGLPIPRSRWKDVLPLGAHRHSTGSTLKRVYVERPSAIAPEMQPFVPFLARREIVPMRIEMHPGGMWAAALRNVIGPAHWKAIRANLYITAGYVCEVCGSGHGALEAWELWDYVPPAFEGGRGVMTLKKLVSVCHACHEMCRLDEAKHRGRSDQAATRMQTVNAWSEAEYLGYLDWARRLYAFRSKTRWDLDLSVLAAFGPVTLAKAWQPDETSEELRATTSVGNVRVRILGLDYECDRPVLSMIPKRPAVLPVQPDGVLISAPSL